MKRLIALALGSSSLLLFGACSQPVSSAPEEATGATSEALGEVGCSSVGISAAGSATTNEGASFSNATFENCNTTPNVTFTSSAIYAGTASCPDAAILELKNPQPSMTTVPRFSVAPSPAISEEGDCGATEVEGTVWGLENGAWTKLYQQTIFGDWSASNVCQYNGNSDFELTPPSNIGSGYTTLRFVAQATETTGLKGTPTTKQYPVKLLAYDTCVN